jgi:CubicO group peptidase (beta-lactamase class C family)
MALRGRFPLTLALPISLAPACGPASATVTPEDAATCVATEASATAPPGIVDPELQPPERFDVNAIDAYVRAIVDKEPMVGLSVGIMRDGEIVMAKGYGVRELTKNAAVEPGTPFAIASITKQFVCATASQLDADGVLSLDDPVAKWFPSLTRAEDISLFDALSHTAGYRDFYPLDYVIPRMADPIETDALIEEFGSQPLDFEPRSRYSYSNTGYLIAGRAIERSTGIELESLLKRRIFDPVGMKRTFFLGGPRSDVPADAAVGHMAFALGAPEVAVPEGPGWTHAAGAMWSTPSDLLAWDRALVDGEVMSKDAYERMTERVTLSDGRKTGYGCGIGVARFHGEAILVHTGGVAGFVSKNVVIPRTRSAVVVMANSSTFSPFPLLDEILALVVAEDRDVPSTPAVAAEAPEVVARELFAELQAGVMRRDRLSSDFNAFLNDERLAEAAPRLRALGDPVEVETEWTGERGGMQVARIRLRFDANPTVLVASMYRRNDGTIEQFLIRAL